MSERFVVIGAGTMGIGIAYVAAGAGYQVEIVEVDPSRAEAAQRTLHSLWDKAVERGRMSADGGRRGPYPGDCLRTDLARVADGPDVIVEAVPERLDLKRRVLAAAEARAPRAAGQQHVQHLDRHARRAAGRAGALRRAALLQPGLGDGAAGDRGRRRLPREETAGRGPHARRAGWARTRSWSRDMPGFATSRLGRRARAGGDPDGRGRGGQPPPTSTRRWCSATGTRWARWS